ncbi:hypothetical protein [Paraburkholderia sp. 40]|uniref:hypothetical protein n=1 Tax=Paraburkholderia sp. 40 TaxID=2991059 RepID=UPI003D209964
MQKMLLDMPRNIYHQRCRRSRVPVLVTPLLRRDMNPVLVAHGANANHLDAQCGTALQMAIAQRNTAVADALRQTGATE